MQCILNKNLLTRTQTHTHAHLGYWLVVRMGCIPGGKYGSDTESDDLSSEDEHRNISRANKSGHNTIEKNFGWDKL